MKTGKTILVGIAAGLLASWLKSLAEPPLQKIGLELFPATENELKIDGADITGHPENMPPANLIKDFTKDFTGEIVSDKKAVEMMSYIHYALGTIIGISYAIARNKNKNVGWFGGIPAGFMIFTSTHGSAVPALDLQGKLKVMPKSWWIWEMGSHILFGFFLEQSTKIFKKIL